MDAEAEAQEKKALFEHPHLFTRVFHVCLLPLVFEMQADRVYKPGPLFECLITCVLELPPSFSEKLCTPLQQTPPRKQITTCEMILR